MNAFPQLVAAVDGLNVPPGSRILVAVSGGPDSVALLDCLDRMRGGYRWNVWIAHINHALRGSESDGDEAFVRALATERGLPLLARLVDTRAYAAERRLSAETAARELRYRAFDAWRREVRADVVLTAHTADDQAETLVMHFLRGSGLAGLRGMPPASGWLLRPFLSVSHTLILQALEERGIPYRSDSSNLDTSYARNRVRHVVFPALGQIVPDPVRALVRTAELVGRDIDYARDERDRALSHLDLRSWRDGISVSRYVWLRLHPALRRHTLLALAGRVLPIDTQLTAAHIDDLMEVIERAERGREVAARMPGGSALQVLGGRFSLQRCLPPPAALSHRAFPIPGDVDLPLGRLTSEVIETGSAAEMEQLITVRGPYVALLGPGALRGRVQTRSRAPGDRMRPAGLRGSRKVQDLMVDGRIPRDLRELWPVVADDQGILWIPGLRVDERAVPGPGSTNAVLLRYTPKRAEGP